MSLGLQAQSVITEEKCLGLGSGTPSPSPLTLHQPALFCSGRPVSSLASSVLQEQRPQPIRDICLTDMMQMHLCDMSNSLSVHSSESIRLFKEAINAFKPPPHPHPIVTVTQWIFMNKPMPFMRHHIRHDLNMSGQFNLKMGHDNDAVWGRGGGNWGKKIL